MSVVVRSLFLNHSKTQNRLADHRDEIFRRNECFFHFPLLFGIGKCYPKKFRKEVTKCNTLMVRPNRKFDCKVQG